MTTLTVKELNELILSGADPNLVGSEIHKWELAHDTEFIYPSHKPQKPKYIHPSFGEVPEIG
jgi:hypothetical protein